MLSFSFRCLWGVFGCVRGHLFSPTFLLSIPPSSPPPSVSPPYIIPQQHLQSSPIISKHLWVLYWLPLCWRIWLVKTFRTLLSHIDHKQVEIICTYTRLRAGDSTIKGKTTLNIPIYCLVRWRILVSVDPSVVLLSKLTTLITTISSYC